MQGNKLAYSSYQGSGRPVLFLHGFLESRTMWADGIADRLNLYGICIDLPGHGESKAIEILSMNSMSKEVSFLADELQLTNYDVVGHSMGGYVGLELLKNDPRCERLVLLNSNFWEDSESKRKDRARVAEIVKSNKFHFLYEAIPNLFLDPEHYSARVKALLEEAKLISSEAIGNASLAMAKRIDHSGLVTDQAQNILIIQGAEDSIVNEKRMTQAVEGLDVVYTQFEECGHMAHIEQTDKLLSVLENFLQ